MNVAWEICLSLGFVAGVVAGGIWLARRRARRTAAQWKVVQRLLSADRWFLPKELTVGEDGHVDPLLYQELQRLIRNGDVELLGAESPQPLHKLSRQGGERVRTERWR